MLNQLQVMGIDVWLPRPSPQDAVATESQPELAHNLESAAYKPQQLAGIAACPDPQVIFIAMPSTVVELAPMQMQDKAGADAFVEPIGSMTAAMLKACHWQQLLLLKQAPDFAQLLTQYSPRLIMLMGLQAAQLLDKNCLNIKSLRNKIHQLHGVNCLVSYHPQAAFLDVRFKRPLWQDLQQAQALLARS